MSNRLKLNFAATAPHGVRPALIAELPSAQRCTLTALQPQVWDDIAATILAAESNGIVHIVSPKLP
ncbi:MAG: hypothetical protein ACK5JI_10875 [Azonexus sp.]